VAIFIGQLASVLLIRMDFLAEMLQLIIIQIITHVFADGGLLWTFVLFFFPFWTQMEESLLIIPITNLV
jgi:hypothetical protein